MGFILKCLKNDLKPYKARIIFYIFILGIVISALNNLNAPFFQKLVEGWKSNDKEISFYLPLVMALNLIVLNIFRYFHLFKMKYTSDQVAVSLRKKLLNKYLHLDLSFFQGNESGSGGLISKMMTDINEVQAGLPKLADVIRAPFMAFFAFGYMLYLDWQLTLFIIVAIPPVALILKSLAKSVRKYTTESFTSMERLTQTLKECLDGIRIIQSFNLQKPMKEKYDDESETFLATRKKINSREEFSGPISEVVTAIMISMLLLYVGMQILDEKMTIASFIAYMTSIAILQDAIRKFQSAYVRLQGTSAALQRIHSILEHTPTIVEPNDTKTFPENWSSINYNNVSFRFGDKKVLNSVNIKINKGEKVALVGSSGGGKSTFVNLLERFYDPTSGEICIDDTAIKDFSLKDLRSNIALVSQDVFLFDDTIENNIHAGDFSKNKQEIQKAAQSANAHNFIEKTEGGYLSRTGDLGGLLSGGEKQRISLARAFLKNAPILILDEATSALDSESEKEVQKALDLLMKDKTAIIIAHRLSTITNADRILVLKNGEIIEQGKHQELLDLSGEYKKLYQLQHH